MQRLYTVRELAEAVLSHARGEATEPAGTAWDALLAPSAADDAALRQWLRPHLVVPGLLLAVLKALLLLVRAGVRIEVSGIDRLPLRGPYLICPNHQSYLDPFLLIGVLPSRVIRQLFFVGASEYFVTPLTRWLAAQVNLVPVDPDASLVSAMQAGAFGLRNNRVLVLFPEGERSIDGSVKTFKKGAAILSRHLQAPVVPVAIDGLFEIWPRNRPFRWRRLLPGSGARVRVAVGEPLSPDPHGVDRAEPSYQAWTAALRSAVERLMQVN